MILKINPIFGLSSTLDEQMTVDGARARDKAKGSARRDRRGLDRARARLRWPNDERRGTTVAPATSRARLRRQRGQGR
jgi:hypothetical protein